MSALNIFAYVMGGFYLACCVYVATWAVRYYRLQIRLDREEACPRCEQDWAQCRCLESDGWYRAPGLCDCTDCGRNQPLGNCPRCGGIGELK